MPFIEGAKGGFETFRLKSFPISGNARGISVFRASGAWIFIGWYSCGFQALNIPIQTLIDALPDSLYEATSGSEPAMMVETMRSYGADSFAAIVLSVSREPPTLLFTSLPCTSALVGIKQITLCGCGRTDGRFGDYRRQSFLAYLFFA